MRVRFCASVFVEASAQASRICRHRSNSPLGRARSLPGIEEKRESGVASAAADIVACAPWKPRPRDWLRQKQPFSSLLTFLSSCDCDSHSQSRSRRVVVGRSHSTLIDPRHLHRHRFKSNHGGKAKGTILYAATETRQMGRIPDFRLELRNKPIFGTYR